MTPKSSPYHYTPLLTSDEDDSLSFLRRLSLYSLIPVVSQKGASCSRTSFPRRKATETKLQHGEEGWTRAIGGGRDIFGIVPQ